MNRDADGGQITDRDYEWDRFWAPRDQAPNLTDGGYLLDPRDGWGRRVNQHVIPLTDVLKGSCVVLRGEPGIGKTVALEAEKEAFTKSIADAGNLWVWHDLRSYGDENRLIQDTFGSATFSEWLAGGQILDLVLDSLDECCLRLTNIFDILRDELERLPRDRLRLRLVCRTAGSAWLVRGGTEAVLQKRARKSACI